MVPGTETFYVCEIIDDRPFPISEILFDGLKTWGAESGIPLKDLNIEGKTC